MLLKDKIHLTITYTDKENIEKHEDDGQVFC